MKRISLFLGIPLLLAACSLGITPAPPATQEVSPYLHVEGSQILNASGQPIYLRGVNLDTYYYSYIWDPAAPLDYATRDDIQYLASLGVTAVRLGFHWRYFESDLGYDLIDSYLDWCEQAGIYVILDLHVVPPEDDVLQGYIWDDPTAQQDFLDLWTAIASRYAARSIVAGYDLYNEPAPPAASQWWQLAEEAAAAIRAVDPNHILFVENPLIEEDSFQLISDDNVVYSFHDYNPFAVTHALAGWVGDSPPPADYSYPGRVLLTVEWANMSRDAAVFTGSTAEWLRWDSGVCSVPQGVEFASLKLAAWGDVGSVWFDDLEVVTAGVMLGVWNSGAEVASPQEPWRPADWYFWTESDYTGAWSREQAHSGAYSLKIDSSTGAADGQGSWIQDNWILTAPLFRVQAGDTLRARGWILAPTDILDGGVSLGFDYLRGIYEDYDRSRLLADMQPYLSWAQANNVPLYVGEFGSMSAAPGDSRYNLAEDKISVMNAAGLHWTMWTYRDADPEGTSFGLFHNSTLDERLAEVLRQGLEERP